MLSGSLDKLIREWVQGEIKLDSALKQFEKRYIEAALAHSEGNRSLAARKLGIHRNTLTNKLKTLD